MPPPDPQSQDARRTRLEAIKRLDDLGLLDDSYGSAVKNAILDGYALPSDFEELDRRNGKLATQESLGTRPVFRPPVGLSTTGVRLGTDQRGCPVLVDLLSSPQHLMVTGATGAGKSSFWHSMLTGLLRPGVDLLAVDLYKSELRALAALTAHAGQPVAVLSASDLRWNPVQTCPGVDPRRHIHRLCDLLIRVLELPSLAGILLRRAMIETARRFGVFSGRFTKWPTLFDVFVYIKTVQSNYAARESLLDRLGGLLMELGPDVLAYRSAWTAADFLGRTIVLELAGSSARTKSFVSSALLQDLFEVQISRGAINSRLRHVLLLEDAQRQLEQISGSGMTPIEEQLGLVRSAGLMVAMNVQSMASLPAAMLSNISLVVAGHMGSVADLKRVSAELGLSPAQTQWAKHNLRAGRFVARHSIGAWREPFVLNVERPVITMPTEETIAASRAQLDAIPVVNAEEFQDWSPWAAAHNVHTESSNQNMDRSTTDETGPDHDHCVTQLTEYQQRLLLAAVDHPMLALSKYPALSSMKPADAKQARLALIDLGLVVVRTLSTRSRGRPSQIIEPTKAGITLASKLR